MSTPAPSQGGREGRGDEEQVGGWVEGDQTVVEGGGGGGEEEKKLTVYHKTKKRVRPRDCVNKGTSTSTTTTTTTTTKTTTKTTICV